MPYVTIVTRWERAGGPELAIMLSRWSSREAALRPETSQGAARRPGDSQFWGDGVRFNAPEVRRTDEPARSVEGMMRDERLDGR